MVGMRVGGLFMGNLLGLARAIDRVNEWIGRSVGWCILAAVLLSAGNAVVRKLFNTSSNAFLEAQWYLYGAAFLGAAAYTLHRNEHIRIDILYGALSRRSQHWIDLLGHLVFLMPFVLLMDLYFVPYVLQSVRSGEMSNNNTRSPDEPPWTQVTKRPAANGAASWAPVPTGDANRTAAPPPAGTL